MNIIQLQDRLKGMPDEAIVQYVQNPTGEVPTYLALGELQRRKDMRDRYEAMKMPEQTVADQVVEESIPQGLGALGQGALQGMAMGQGLTSMPSEAPMPTTDELASSGLGALPADNVGQNYAGGGIVAFQDGGLADPYGINPFSFLPRRYEEDDPRFPTLFDDPFKMIQKEPIEDVESPELFEYDIKKEAERRKKEQEEKEFEAEVEDKIRKSGDQQLPTKEQKQETPAEEPQEEPKTPMTDEEKAAYLALAQAGFETMAGQSPFALSNLGAGAAAGVKGYQEQLGKIQERKAAAATALAKAEQNARANRIDVDKAAREYVESVFGKADALDDEAKTMERNQAYQIRKAELLYEIGYLTQDQLQSAINAIGTTGQSSVEVGGKKFKVIR